MPQQAAGLGLGAAFDIDQHPGLDPGRRISIRGFAEQFHLSRAATNAIISELKSAEVATELFRFDQAEFKSQVGYRSVELDNGGMLTAETGEFDKVFHREEIDRGKRVRFSTEGEIVDDKLRKVR
jgi:hypothetical protein